MSSCRCCLRNLSATKQRGLSNFTAVIFSSVHRVVKQIQNHLNMNHNSSAPPHHAASVEGRRWAVACACDESDVVHVDLCGACRISYCYQCKHCHNIDMSVMIRKVGGSFKVQTSGVACSNNKSRRHTSPVPIQSKQVASVRILPHCGLR
jgi:hypothetical protein